MPDGGRMIWARPVVLDLFCKEGGAAKGYADAGFEVIGVDIAPQPRYPFRFFRNDALRVLRNLIELNGAAGWRVDAIHASPPCQKYSQTQRLRGNEHPDLIAATRVLLDRTGLPYVIENVEEARSELVDPVTLCGTMFAKPYYRHRLFECSFPVTAPLHGPHWLKQVKMGRSPGENELLQAVGNFAGVERAREEFEMPWASRDGLRECVPPAYTEHIGSYLMAAVTMGAAA